MEDAKTKERHGRARDPRGNRRGSRGKGDKSYNAWTRHINLAKLAEKAPWRLQGRRWLTGSTFASTEAYCGVYGAGQGLGAIALALLPAPGYIHKGVIFAEGPGRQR